MTPAPYIIITAASLDILQIEVQLKMKLGYQLQGGPFNAGPYALPHIGISQAMSFPAPTTVTTASVGGVGIANATQTRGKR